MYKHKFCRWFPVKVDDSREVLSNREVYELCDSLISRYEYWHERYKREDDLTPDVIAGYVASFYEDYYFDTDEVIYLLLNKYGDRLYTEPRKVDFRREANYYCAEYNI